MGLKPIEAVLRELKLDAASLRPFSADPSILTFEVPGGPVATDAWQKLRAALDRTGRWPIICGDAAEEADNLEAVFEESGDTVEQTLAQVPPGAPLAALREHERRSREAMADYLRSQGEEVPPYLANPELFESADDAEDPDAKPAEWPDLAPRRELALQSTVDVLSDEPHERCLIALLPTAQPAEAPAYLRFGGFNACPGPELHVAFLRDWGRRYGAVPACITHDIIECVVARPPWTRDDARALAAEQFVYCGDIVSQGTGTVERLAAELWASPMWYFWWD